MGTHLLTFRSSQDPHFSDPRGPRERLAASFCCSHECRNRLAKPGGHIRDSLRVLLGTGLQQLSHKSHLHISAQHKTLGDSWGKARGQQDRTPALNIHPHPNTCVSRMPAHRAPNQLVPAASHFSDSRVRIPGLLTSTWHSDLSPCLEFLPIRAC